MKTKLGEKLKIIRTTGLDINHYFKREQEMRLQEHLKRSAMEVGLIGMGAAMSLGFAIEGQFPGLVNSWYQTGVAVLATMVASGVLGREINRCTKSVMEYVKDQKEKETYLKILKEYESAWIEGNGKVKLGEMHNRESRIWVLSRIQRLGKILESSSLNEEIGQEIRVLESFAKEETSIKSAMSEIKLKIQNRGALIDRVAPLIKANLKS